MLLLSKYSKASKLIVCLLLFKSNIGQNLISNGSFENYTNPIDCNSGGFENYSIFPTNHVVDNWYPYNSPDYFNSICFPGGVNAPNNIFGYSVAKNGNNYAGFILFQKAGDLKEYIYQQLSVPLQAGKVYCLDFSVSRADRITHAIESIGAYFSGTLPPLTNFNYINVTPQIVNNGSYITDTTQWTQIHGCFTANGGEQYITIGNFNSNANTDTLYVGTNNQVSGANGYAYYYIDDIQLWDALTTDIRSVDGTTLSVYPNPATDIITIECKMLNNNSDLQIRLSDVIGREILLTEYKSQFDISFIEKGIYFISILKNNRTLVTQKIVKE